jgi:hypothetical protein
MPITGGAADFAGASLALARPTAKLVVRAVSKKRRVGYDIGCKLTFGYNPGKVT